MLKSYPAATAVTRAARGDDGAAELGLADELTTV
jgi:hypothetical protein